MTPWQVVAIAVCGLIVGFAMGLIASAWYDEHKEKKKDGNGNLPRP